jgi:hypothetical protein
VINGVARELYLTLLKRLRGFWAALIELEQDIQIFIFKIVQSLGQIELKIDDIPRARAHG